MGTCMNRHTVIYALAFVNCYSFNGAVACVDMCGQESLLWDPHAVVLCYH